MSRQSDFITLARQSNRKIWEGVNELLALQREWNGLDYGNTLADGVGENAGIARADVGAVVFATADAIKAVQDAGHATNMAKLL